MIRLTHLALGFRYSDFVLERPARTPVPRTPVLVWTIVLGVAWLAAGRVAAAESPSAVVEAQVKLDDGSIRRLGDLAELTFRRTAPTPRFRSSTPAGRRTSCCPAGSSPRSRCRPSAARHGG